MTSFLSFFLSLSFLNRDSKESGKWIPGSQHSLDHIACFLPLAGSSSRFDLDLVLPGFGTWYSCSSRGYHYCCRSWNKYESWGTGSHKTSIIVKGNCFWFQSSLRLIKKRGFPLPHPTGSSRIETSHSNILLKWKNLYSIIPSTWLSRSLFFFRN